MPDHSPPPVILILGGTTDAFAIARTLDALNPRLDVVSSFAGKVKTLNHPPGRVRVGGFGGAEGLRTFLSVQNVAAVIDATHPFAAQISANARAACDTAGVPRLQVRRPEWPRHPDDHWIEVDTVTAAAACLPRYGTRPFLTVGLTELGPFVDRPDLWCLVRVVDPPATPLLHGPHLTLAARGPFSEDNDWALMQQHRIDVLLTKHAGGSATIGKLAAARHLGIPVIMVRRPPAEPGDTAPPSGVVAWLQHLGLAR